MALRQIGAGFCGTVWAAALKDVTAADQHRAIKREDGGPSRFLSNDFTMHQKVLLALHGLAPSAGIYIPDCYQYVKNDDSAWWTDNIRSFPQQYQTPCNALITDRIQPFSEQVRHRIIDTYCPERLRTEIKASERNQDCLVRPYLGRRRRLRTQSRSNPFFSLRNHPLHLDQMEDLELDIQSFAKILAETLAYLFWVAHVDANDIEFVLALPPFVCPEKAEEGSAPREQRIFRTPFLGDHVLWMLDFDCCRSMAMDEAGVLQAVNAFYCNDPYYPRPGRADLRDQVLWQTFKDSFLATSSAILGRSSTECGLPAKWIEIVEARGSR